jgi:hypothetical protein
MIIIDVPIDIWDGYKFIIGDVINFTYKLAKLVDQPVKIISRKWDPNKPLVYTIELQRHNISNGQTSDLTGSI